VLQGVYVVSKPWAVVGASGIVLGAAYMLWLYQRTMFGTVTNPKNERLPDLSLREFATFAPLLVLAVWIGLYPKPFLDRLDTSVDRVVARVNSIYTPRLAQVEANGEPPAWNNAPAAGERLKAPGSGLKPELLHEP